MKNYIFLLILLLFSCTSKNNLQDDKLNKEKKIIFDIVDSLDIEDGGFWYPDGQIKNNYLFSIDKDMQRIEMYSKKGELITYFGEKGKGPGEFENITRFDIHNDDIFIIDKQKFSITHIKIENKSLKFINEFKLKKQPTQLCIIKKGLLLITFPADIHNLKLFSYTGELLKEYSIPKKEKFKNKKDFLSSSYWIDNLDDRYFVLGNISELNLYFCEFNSNNFEISLIKSSKFAIKFKRKKFIFKNSNTVDIMGLSTITHFNKHYLFSLRADIKELSKTFFGVYDKDGNYLGRIYLNGYKAIYKAFSDKGDTLWFKTFDKDDKIFVAKRKEL